MTLTEARELEKRIRRERPSLLHTILYKGSPWTSLEATFRRDKRFSVQVIPPKRFPHRESVVFEEEKDYEDWTGAISTLCELFKIQRVAEGILLRFEIPRVCAEEMLSFPEFRRAVSNVLRLTERDLLDGTERLKEEVLDSTIYADDLLHGCLKIEIKATVSRRGKGESDDQG